MIYVRSCILFCGLTFALVASAQDATASGFKILHLFKNGRDGAYPAATPSVDGQGIVHGTTFGKAGANAPGKHCPKSCGNVYSILEDGSVTTEHSFNHKDGSNPSYALLALNGDLYGVTTYGGLGRRAECGSGGCGTVFKLAADGTETVLYSFCIEKNCTDGRQPSSGLIADAAGNLYGETDFGGAHGGGGVVYKISPGGGETVLYSFCRLKDCVDGNGPNGGLLADGAGNLFGTTADGGVGADCPFHGGCGAVFRIAPDGTETVLYSFCARSFCTDGAYPGAGLVADGSGNLYGATVLGGGADCDLGCGVVFKLAPQGAETVLHTFLGNADGDGDGAAPSTTLTADGQGNLYGTTFDGGLTGPCDGNECGTIFKLAPDGTETILHYFCSEAFCRDGGSPYAGLTLSGDYLYGAAGRGGKSYGTVFRIRKK